MSDITGRLEYLRSQIQAEDISYGEIAELQGLTEHIDPGDIELLQWAGVPEFPQKARIRVMVPAYFDVDMTVDAYMALTLDEREDVGFDVLGKYPTLDLRNASFDVEDLYGWDEE